MRGKPSPRRYQAKPEEIPSGICECGCGHKTPIAIATIPSLRYFFGHPKPFVPSHHARLAGRKQLLRDFRPSVPEAAYIAGIVDGEGTITIQGRRVRVSISNTDWNLIEWLRGYGGWLHAQKPHPNRRQGYRWGVGQRADCLRLLAQIEPYLIIKRGKAQEALALLRSL